MVSDDIELPSIQVRMESLHSEYDRHEFALETGVSLFSGCKTLACICDGSELAACVWLEECSSNTSQACIALQVCRFTRIKVVSKELSDTSFFRSRNACW